MCLSICELILRAVPDEVHVARFYPQKGIKASFVFDHL